MRKKHTLETSERPKRVVYILGAGSTQAEADHLHSGQFNLLMSDNEELGLDGISRRVLQRARIGRKRLQKELDISDKNIDIEKLISLLAATGTDKNMKFAEALRRAYYDEIMESLNNAGVLKNPELAIKLLKLHSNKPFNEREKLLGVINLNHDNLFQTAFQKVHKCINLGFNFYAETFYIDGYEKECPLLIQLHGAFNWRKSLPIDILTLDNQAAYNPNMLWIPPTILKEAKDYPFNKLMGFAYELLKMSDILRVIGCSLSQNDWNLISIIFNAQHNQYINTDKCFKIELIMDQDYCDKVIKEYSYLKNILPIGQLEDGLLDAYLSRKEERSKPSELDNPFEYWLKIKVNHHTN
jgi:hypothetical protein